MMVCSLNECSHFVRVIREGPPSAILLYNDVGTFFYYPTSNKLRSSPCCCCCCCCCCCYCCCCYYCCCQDRDSPFLLLISSDTAVDETCNETGCRTRANILKKERKAAYIIAACCLPMTAELVFIVRANSVQRRLPQGHNKVWKYLSGCIAKPITTQTHLLKVYGALILGWHPKLDRS